MEHSKQHWVPRSYLAAWCDPNCPPRYEPYVWRFAKNGDAVQRKSPTNLFVEADFYTVSLKDGSRDLSMERWLGRLESKFCKIRDKRIEKHERLTLEEKGWFCGFVAAMHYRVRPQRDAFRQQWKHALRVAEDLRDALNRMTPKQRRVYRPPATLQKSKGPSLNIDDVRELAANPIQHILPASFAADLRVLTRMNLSVLTTDDDVGFITSDFPCIWFDPQGGRFPPMLQSRTIEVTMPISPHSLAVISWQDLPHYERTTLSELHAANRNQQIGCEEYIIACRNVSHPIWFC